MNTKIAQAVEEGNLYEIEDMVNAALAAADLGIAIGSGTDAAKEAGDIILVQGDLSKVIEALKISRASYNVIRQNLFWAFGYNLLALPLAIFAQVPPALAAAAMSLSSITVVLNALRLYGKKFTEPTL